jgi:hypothetical protein
MYVVAHHQYASPELSAALKQGWEPFGVTGDLPDATVWVRRSVTQLRERGDPTLGPPDPGNPQRARDLWKHLMGPRIQAW